MIKRWTLVCVPMCVELRIQSSTPRVDMDTMDALVFPSRNSRQEQKRPAVGVGALTYHLTKAHRLHQIPRLCSACSKIDIRAVAVSERYVLLTDLWGLEKSATGCRFCAFLIQTLRGKDRHDDVGAALAPFGLTRKHSCSLCLSLEAGILRVYVVAYPDEIGCDGFSLAEFPVYLDEGASSVGEVLGEMGFEFFHSCGKLL